MPTTRACNVTQLDPSRRTGLHGSLARPKVRQRRSRWTPVREDDTTNAERALVALLERQVDQQDGHAAGNARREREIAELIATFAPTTALAIQRRLDRSSPDDGLVRAFHRLVSDRRKRIYDRLAANRVRVRRA